MIITNCNYEVARTGKLQQQYTLFCYRSVLGDGISIHRRQFQQNVGKEEATAIAKAEELAGCKVGEFIKISDGFNKSLEFFESAPKPYQSVECFDLVWKNTEKGYTAYPNGEFWKLWKVKKEMIRELGFKVYKDYKGSFQVFISMENLEKLITGEVNIEKVIDDFTPKPIFYPYFETREEALKEYDKLEPSKDYDGSHLEKSNECRKQSNESFERCDTDGCVTQYCDNLTASKHETMHDLEMHNGMFYFPALIDIETKEIVSTQVHYMACQFSHTYVNKWKTKDGNWITFYKRESGYTKKGVQKVWILAPAYVDTRSKFNHTKEARGFSGLTSIRYSRFIDHEKLGFNI